MIDLHAHILPAVDDGPADLEESLAMGRDAVEQGLTAVAATPHFFGRPSWSEIKERGGTQGTFCPGWPGCRSRGRSRTDAGHESAWAGG